MSYTRPPIPVMAHAVGTLTDPDVSANPTASGTYPTADLAIYCPLRVFSRVTVRTLFVSNGSAVSGNVCVALYDQGGTRLATSGSVAQSGTTNAQIFDVTDVVIGPGIYYIATVLDNTTGAMLRDADGAPMCAARGILTEQLGAGAALPSTASWAVDHTLAYLPSAGFFIEGTSA